MCLSPALTFRNIVVLPSAGSGSLKIICRALFDTEDAFETAVAIQPATQCHIPEDLNPQQISHSQVSRSTEPRCRPNYSDMICRLIVTASRHWRSLPYRHYLTRYPTNTNLTALLVQDAHPPSCHEQFIIFRQKKPTTGSVEFSAEIYN